MSTYPPPVVPLWAALVVGVSYGPITDAAFPDQDAWPLVFVGVSCLLVSLIGRSFWSGLLVGLMAGLSFFLVHISWASLYLGPLPWVALSGLQALIFGCGAGLVACAYRWVPAAWPTAMGRLVVVPAVVAGLWLAREQLAGSWPYGGFAWGRVALSQSTSPFADLFPWVGASGLSFLIVALCATAVQLVREPTVRLGQVVAALALVVTLTVVPSWEGQSSGVVRVAAVQGNGDAGYFSARQPGDLLRAQVQASSPLRGTDIDVVVWPENSMEDDPLSSPAAAAAVDGVARALQAPLVLGAVTQRDDRFFNTSMLWQPGQGATDLYDKKHPVPFGEYVPDRAFWEPFAPDLIGLIQRDYEIGTRDGVFQIDEFALGVAICFDVADDRVMRDLVIDGAEILVVQSNNADFGRTDESVQQQAIARIRALETGRTVVNISTVGVSSMISPDGRTTAALPWYTPGVMVENVTRGTGMTPAMVWGEAIVAAGTTGGLVVLVVAAVLVRGGMRGGRPMRLPDRVSAPTGHGDVIVTRT